MVTHKPLTRLTKTSSHTKFQPDLLKHAKLLDGEDLLEEVHAGDVIDNDENVRAFNVKCKEIFALIQRNNIIMYTFTGRRRRKHRRGAATGGIP